MPCSRLETPGDGMPVHPLKLEAAQRLRPSLLFHQGTVSGPVQEWVHRKHSVGGMRVPEVRIAVPTSSQLLVCWASSFQPVDPEGQLAQGPRPGPTRSSDAGLPRQLYTWLQFQKHQENPLDAPKPCPPAS